MVAGTLMNIECVRLVSGASLLNSLELAGKSGQAMLAVIEPDGVFLGSLDSAVLVTELAGSGWHCGHSTITGALDGTSTVGFSSLVDTACPRVGPEVPAAGVASLLALLPCGGFVAVVDSNGVLLGTITHAGLIAGFLALSDG